MAGASRVRLDNSRPIACGYLLTIFLLFLVEMQRALVNLNVSVFTKLCNYYAAVHAG